MDGGALSRFVKSLEAERNASKETVRAYLREVRALRGHLAETAGKDPEGADGWGFVTAADLRRFLSASLPGRESSSVCRRLSAVRTFFSFLVEIGELRANPAAGLSAPRRAMRLPEFLRWTRWRASSPRFRRTTRRRSATPRSSSCCTPRGFGWASWYL